MRDRERSQCVVIVGSQWGDEGKGKIVDVLAEDVDVVARYQGGSNAGHTVHVGEEEFILHQIPSGILHPRRRCLLGNGVVFDPFQFFQELDALTARGIDAEGRVGVSGRAHLLLSYHKVLDRAAEARRGAGKIGTTGRGIGPAYEDKVARQGIRLADLRDWPRAQDALRRAAERVNERLQLLKSDETVDAEALIAEVGSIRERLLAISVDTGRVIHDALRDGHKVLLEGAQGTILDVDHGTYPYVTSSNTTAGGAALGVGIGPTLIDDVVGVVKAYTTRVGEGPLPTEFPSPMQEQVRELGGEYGATTGRPRRCGWFDAVVVRYAARVNGLTGLAVTKLDVLDTLPELKIATSYRAEGQELDDFPGDLGLLEAAEPVYETLPGWQTSTAGARKWDDLPRNAQAYLRRLSELTDTPIWYVSVGTRRDQIIHVRP
ncbi:adenylosuccinate synthase [Longimicrobium terrae]|uniref:Adenylosuccinate synthetase n=1 Tax=Longimicrobium terrae TaxID=1639882 RepID=A0A841H1G7_9BACT|nr:adenylosuccinate synthase [Longimicrobium terrae]MBB4637459.1 adenylosuccinate synthase [Longimicrobium terrae]MBB6071857.1 adenylosuccinate synthase [Longimicrobium terrae]NNC30406.1 adenylosuccinate synthase [Longimicrobium terrae]